MENSFTKASTAICSAISTSYIYHSQSTSEINRNTVSILCEY